jgi:DNA-binding NarL/FixJ family response regulator
VTGPGNHASEVTGAETGRIRVLIADDQALMRGGFRMILESQPDIEVVGEARDGEEAVAQCRRLAPDVVLMDVRMPRLDGIEATRQILSSRSGQCHVLVLTMFDLDEYVYRSLEAGASGFLLKDVTPEHLVYGVRLVAAGEQLLAPAVTRRLIERHLKRRVPVPDQATSRLTGREREVISQLANGLSNGEIAIALDIGEATVKTHIANILEKLELQDRVQIVIYAYEMGLVGRDS